MKTIEELAREAGLPPVAITADVPVVYPTNKSLERFADLVREEYKAELLVGLDVPVTYQYLNSEGTWSNFVDQKHIYNTRNDGWPIRELYTFKQLAAAVLRERERCASICDGIQAENENKGTWLWEAKNCATAIRNLG